MPRKQKATEIQRPNHEDRERTVALEPDVDELPVPTGDPVAPLQREYNVLMALDVLRGLNRNTEALMKSLVVEISSFPWGPGDGSDERRDSIERIAHLSANVRDAAIKAVRAGDKIAREALRSRRPCS